MDDAAAFTLPDPDPTSPRAPWRDDGHGRRSAPDVVWAAVRADYLSGMSGAEACRRHGVRLSALRDRAAREGWRRADQPWTPPTRLDPDDEGVALEADVNGDLEQIGLRDVAWVAFRRMIRAAVRGDAVAALRWRRLRAVLDAEAAELEVFAGDGNAASPWRSPETPETDSSDSSDASDGVFAPTG